MFPKLTYLILALYAATNLCAQKTVLHRDSVDIYFERSECLKALDYSNRLLKTYQKENNVTKLVSVYTKQSKIYLKLGDSKRSIATLYEALALSQKNGNKIAEALALKEMASIYAARLDYNAALRKIRESLAIARKLDNDSIENDLMQLLFKVHLTGNSDSTYFYLKKTELYHKSKNSPERNYSAYSNAFAYYIKIGDTLKAEVYMDSAVTEARRWKSPQILADALSNRAAIYYFKGDFRKAKEYYDEMFRVNPGDSVSYAASDAYYTYSGILAGLGDYKRAYEYAEKSIELQDDVYGLEVNGAVRDIEAKYMLQTAEEKRNRERLVYLIVISVFLISLILLYFFYQNNRLKQKNRLNQIESETQQKLLSATLDARELERKHIASVLHDSVSALLSSAGLQLTAFDSVHGNTSEEISKTRQILKEAHDKVRGLSHELVPTLLSKFGLAYALKDLCEKHSSKQIEFEYQDDGSLKRYDEDFEMKIYFVTSELLNNALKHSKASKAILEISAHNGNLVISLSDNGQGFDTAKPGSEGFGLTQIRARISALKGKFGVSSKPGSGTTASISVPLL